MALITRSFASFSTTVEVLYTFDDVTLDITGFTLRNDGTAPAVFRILHPILGAWSQTISGSNTITLPANLAGLKMIQTAKGISFPLRFEFVGPK